MQGAGSDNGFSRVIIFQQNSSVFGLQGLRSWFLEEWPLSGERKTNRSV